MMRILLVLITCCALLSYETHAKLTIEVTGGREEGTQPIAIVPFHQAAGRQRVPQNVATIISNDLFRSGRFSPLPLHRLPEKPTYFNQIDFPDWQTNDMPYLVIGRIKGGVMSGYTIEFELVDTYRRRRIVGYSYQANTQNLRQVAHLISDEIYQALTGEQGVFSTRIVYVTLQHQNKTTSQYQLYVADADGANPRLMLKSTEPIFSPSWSPDGRRIAYVTYDNIGRSKRMAVYVQDLRTGRRTRVSAKQGLNAAPAWSPDGSHLALTLSQDGNPEIYILNLYTRALTRLTHHTAIDTEAEWSPDGKYLVFTSDRSGQPQVYRISTTGGTVRRITTQGSYNARPRISPDGKKMALLHGNRQEFKIAILHLKTGQLKILTRTTLDESPSFAPNGSMIIYATGTELAAVSIDGRVHQRLAVDMSEEVREPAWSPFNR